MSLEKEKFYYNVLVLIQKGLNLSQVASRFNISRQRLNYLIKPLKVANILEKRGYGAWEVNKHNVKKLPKVGLLTNSRKENIVRGHAFVFTLDLPKIENWNRRELFLRKKRIYFKNIGLKNNIQSIYIRKNKVWLCNKKIVIYFKKGKSYFAHTSQTAKNYAIYDFLSIVRHLENKLGIPLKLEKRCKFRVSRQHYALILNSLAKQYDREGKKLKVLGDDNKFWFEIDNSFNYHEAEHPHPKRGVEDTNTTQKFFNDLRANPTTISEILKLQKETQNQVSQITNNQLYHEKNIKSHIEAIQELAKGVKELRKEIKKLRSQ